MEQLDVTAPVSQPSISTYTVERLNINRSPACIDVTVSDNNGKTSSFTYNGADAVALMTVLNKGNFSVNSLQKQILNKLKNDGLLPTGSVSGVAD